MNPNGDGPAVPAWMIPLGVKEKEWLNMTKAQLKALQRPDKPLKFRVWASGMLHSPGYKGEEATTLRSGNRVPYSMGDLRAELFKVAIEHYKAAGIEIPTDEKELEKLKETKEQLRQTLKELEDEGTALRTNLNKVPLRDLSPAELKRLSNGRIRMFFWAKPKPADAEAVRRDWEKRQQQPEFQKTAQVVPTAPPTPTISQILKALKIEIPENVRTKQMSNPIYQEKIIHAWNTAREEILQVMLTASPKVEAETPPEVVSTAGAFERKVERSSLESPESVSQSEASVDRPTDNLSSDIKSLLIEELGSRLPDETPGPALCKRISTKLQGAPLNNLRLRIRKRLKAITSMGMVEALASDVGARWIEEQSKEGQKAADKRQAEIEALRAIANDPNEPADIREQCLMKLKATA